MIVCACACVSVTSVCVSVHKTEGKEERCRETSVSTFRGEACIWTQIANWMLIRYQRNSTCMQLCTSAQFFVSVRVRVRVRAIRVFVPDDRMKRLASQHFEEEKALTACSRFSG